MGKAIQNSGIFTELPDGFSIVFLIQKETGLLAFLHICLLYTSVSHTNMLTAYSEELFENYADHIEVLSRNEIRFVMKCGLTFTERIGD